MCDPSEGTLPVPLRQRERWHGEVEARRMRSWGMGDTQIDMEELTRLIPGPWREIELPNAVTGARFEYITGFNRGRRFYAALTANHGYVVEFYAQYTRVSGQSRVSLERAVKDLKSRAGTMIEALIIVRGL